VGSGASAIRAGAAYVEVFLEQNALTRSMAATSAKLRGWAAGLGRLGAATRGGALPGPLAAIADFSFSPAGLVTGMLEAVREWAKGGAELVHLSEQAGMTVESFSALSYAAKRTGVDTEQLATGVRKMQVTIAGAARGMPEAGKALLYVGASLRDLAKMRPEEQLRYMADRIAAIPNPTQRAAAAVQIFGRAGTTMLPLLLEGSAGLNRFEQRARDLGLVMSSDSAQGALRFSRALADLQDVGKKCVTVIGSALGPYVEQLTDWITTAAVKIRQWISDHQGLILVLFKAAGAIVLAGAGFSLFGRILGGIAGGLGWIVSGFRLVGAAVSMAGSLLAGAWSAASAAIAAIGPVFAALFSPIGLVVAAVIGLAGYFLYASGAAGAALDWLKGVIGELAKDAMDTFGAIGDALAAGDITLAAKVLWSVLKMEFQKGVNTLTEVWIGFKEIFMHAWTEAVFGIAKIGTSAWGLLQKGWNGLCTGLSATWTIFTDGVKSAWNAVSNWISNSWLWIMEKVGAMSPEQAKQARDALNKEYAENKGRQSAETERKLAATGTEYERRKAEIDQQTSGALGQLDSAKDREHAERQSAYAKQLHESQAEVDKARREFDAARAEAATKRAVFDRQHGGPGAPPKDLFAPMQNMPGAKGEVMGTFSGAVAALLGGGGGANMSPMQQVAKSTEDIAVAQQRANVMQQEQLYQARQQTEKLEAIHKAATIA
jgi:hypothetical protein